MRILVLVMVRKVMCTYDVSPYLFAKTHTIILLDFWGWNFHKDVEVAKGTVIGGEHTGGLDAGSDDTPSLLTNHDGSLCIATHETQSNYDYQFLCNFVMKKMNDNIGITIQQLVYLLILLRIGVSLLVDLI